MNSKINQIIIISCIRRKEIFNIDEFFGLITRMTPQAGPDWSI